MRTFHHSISAITSGLIICLWLLWGGNCQKTEESLVYQKTKALYTREPHNIPVIEKLMMLELLEQDRPQEVIRLYEVHRGILTEQVMVGIYYATALCKMAGIQKKPAEQLAYVRKGMHEFEVLTERWPNEGRVFLWMAITYSNFPELLGADTMVIETIQAITEKIAAGQWQFEKEELRQLVYAYINLAREYTNRAYSEAARTQATITGLGEDEQVQKALALAARRFK